VIFELKKKESNPMYGKAAPHKFECTAHRASLDNGGGSTKRDISRGNVLTEKKKKSSEELLQDCTFIVTGNAVKQESNAMPDEKISEKIWFTNFMASAGGEIVLGDDGACNVLGTGSVKVNNQQRDFQVS